MRRGAIGLVLAAVGVIAVGCDDDQSHALQLDALTAGGGGTTPQADAAADAAVMPDAAPLDLPPSVDHPVDLAPDTAEPLDAIVDRPAPVDRAVDLRVDLPADHAPDVATPPDAGPDLPPSPPDAADDAT